MMGRSSMPKQMMKKGGMAKKKMNMGGMMMGKAKSKPRYAPGNAGKKRPAKPKGIMV